MAVLGTFRLAKTGGWEGSLRTLTVDQKIRLLPNDDRVSEDAPTFRIMLGWQRIGDAWEAQTNGKPPRDYLRLLIDDPSFAVPLRAALFPDEDDKMTARLLWSRRTDV